MSPVLKFLRVSIAITLFCTASAQPAWSMFGQMPLPDARHATQTAALTIGILALGSWLFSGSDNCDTHCRELTQNVHEIASWVKQESLVTSDLANRYLNLGNTDLDNADLIFIADAQTWVDIMTDNAAMTTRLAKDNLILFEGVPDAVQESCSYRGTGYLMLVAHHQRDVMNLPLPQRWQTKATLWGTLQSAGFDPWEKVESHLSGTELPLSKAKRCQGWEPQNVAEMTRRATMPLYAELVPYLAKVGDRAKREPDLTVEQHALNLLIYEQNGIRIEHLVKVLKSHASVKRKIIVRLGAALLPIETAVHREYRRVMGPAYGPDALAKYLKSRKHAILVPKKVLEMMNTGQMTP